MSTPPPPPPPPPPRAVVLLVEGWSPGPLPYLKSMLQREIEGYCEVRYVRGFPMPPFVGWWFCDYRFLALLFGWVAALYSVSRYAHDKNRYYRWLFAMASFAATIGIARLLAALVVRSSLQKGVDICRNEIRRHSSSNNNNNNYGVNTTVVAVGFSWGGAILAELLMQEQQNYDDIYDNNDAINSPASVGFFLIAPTTALLAKVGFQQDAAFRLQQQQHQQNCTNFSRSSERGPVVHVVHASHDRMFCPYPERWNHLTGSFRYSMLRDVHVFVEPSSRRALADYMTRLVSEVSEKNAVRYY